jgi:quercetin dioxygenase-like cupin family protein
MLESIRAALRGRVDVTNILTGNEKERVMQITRLKDAKRYDAPKHFDIRSLRLQGLEASGADFAWTGLSYFLPGGGAEMAAGPLGKIYVVLEGQVLITLGDGSAHTLSKLDSCFIPAGEARAVSNPGNVVAAMLVVMPIG